MNCRKIHNQGSALVLALIALGVLTVIAASSLSRTTMDTSLAAKWNKRSRAEEIADTGLQRIARTLLETYRGKNSINSLLGTVQLGTSSGGQYSVIVTDNNNVGGVDQDGDGNANTDHDKIFRLVSTGKVGQSEQVIEAFYQINDSAGSPTLPASPTGGESAALYCGSGITAELKDHAVMDGDNYLAPTLPCTGSGCNTSKLNTNAWDIIADSALTCTGCTSLTKQTSVGSAANCSDWRTLFDQLSTITTSTTGVTVLSGTSYKGDLNDCTNPKIIIIRPTAATFEIKGRSTMCGLVVVAGNTIVKLEGTVSVVGVMMFMGLTSNSNGIELQPQGTSNLIGKLIFGSSNVSGTKKTTLEGDSNLKFSSEGVGYAQTALSGASLPSAGGGTASLSVVAWRTSSK